MTERVRTLKQIDKLKRRREELYAEAKECNALIGTLQHKLATMDVEPTHMGREWTTEQRLKQSLQMKARWQMAREGTAGELE